MALIKGITVTLYERKQIGKDALNAPIYSESPVQVADVLVTPLTMEEIVSEIQQSGRRAVYELSIPKNDTHAWEGCKVEFFGKNWRVIGPPKRWIPELVPGPWNTKWKVERFE